MFAGFHLVPLNSKSCSSELSVPCPCVSFSGQAAAIPKASMAKEEKFHCFHLYIPRRVAYYQLRRFAAGYSG
jgi:hypothetical protein